MFKKKTIYTKSEEYLQTIERIKEKMEYALEEAGSVKCLIKGSMIFRNDRTGCFHRITFVKGLASFVIESAMSQEEAEKNLFEDSGIYPFCIGEDNIIDEFKKDLYKYYID